MASFTMVYVDHPDDEAIVAAVEAACPGMPTALARLDGNPWAQLRDIEWEMVGLVAEQLSAALKCPAVGFAAQTTVGAVEVHAFEAGALVRRLVYVGGGDGWERVEGERQAWEDAMFEARAHVVDEELDEASRRALETRTPVVGAYEPYVDGFALGDAIGLPGFSARGQWSPERQIGPAMAGRGASPTNWAVLGLIGLLIACLIFDALVLPRSSWWSTAIFVGQLAILVPLIKRAG